MQQAKAVPGHARVQERADLKHHFSGWGSSGELKGDHPARLPPEQPLDPGIVWVLGQAWVQHSGHLRHNTSQSQISLPGQVTVIVLVNCQAAIDSLVDGSCRDVDVPTCHDLHVICRTGHTSRASSECMR